LIRPATVADIPVLVDLGQTMHKESIFAPYNYDTEKVSELINSLITTRFGIALVAEEAGVIVGGFIGVVCEHYFGRDLQSQDLALFIAPEYRQGTTGLKLIKAYIVAAREKGAKQVMLANSTGYQPERVAKLFESLGFVRRGFVFEMPNA
jgi:N-acetylglutamate synthase-like GNAT family acetyltransferase